MQVICNRSGSFKTAPIITDLPVMLFRAPANELSSVFVPGSMLVQSTVLLLAYAGVGLTSPLHGRQAATDFSGTTQNGLTGLQGTNCPQKIVIFARGTTEAGNVGSVAGPPFFQALAQQVGPQNLAVQGVEYAADIPGFLAGGDATGSQTMAQLTQQAITQCPTSKVVMSGYSQGGQLVHNAAAMLPASVTGKVAGVVIFGDPGKPFTLSCHG